MPTTPTSPEPYLKVDELARILGVRPSWIYERTARGEIPHVRIGRYVRLRLSDVERWLSQQQEASNG